MLQRALYPTSYGRRLVRLDGRSFMVNRFEHGGYGSMRRLAGPSLHSVSLMDWMRDERQEDLRRRRFHTVSMLQEQLRSTSTTDSTANAPLMGKKVGGAASAAKAGSNPGTSSTSAAAAAQNGQNNKKTNSKPKNDSQAAKTKESTSLVSKGVSKVVEWTKAFGGIMWTFLKNPLIIRQWSKQGWEMLVDWAKHMWTGFKLLGVEVKTSFGLLRKRLNGHQLTRRERRQLVRTTADLARVVPFMFFIIVPFMEFLLPIALKLFPNMLPSTFQDNFKREEDMKRTLKLRLEMASFLQDMVVEMEQKAKGKNESGADKQISVEEVRHFMERVRMGHQISEETVLRVAKLFSDELTTDNMSRSQLVTLCRYMGLPYFGSDNFLRFQLRTQINSIREDDATIFFEGINSLNLLELKQACQERGMRATGLTMHQLRTQLKRWIDLSVNKNVPLSLLILSRVFTLEQTDKSKVELAISEAISQMDEDVLQQALVAGAEAQELAVDKNTLSRLKLEAINAQNELIENEIKEKARKREFLEQLRLKAQSELDSQQDQLLQDMVESSPAMYTNVEPAKLSKIDEEIVLEKPMVDKAKPLILETEAELLAQQLQQEQLQEAQKKKKKKKVLASEEKHQQEQEMAPEKSDIVEEQTPQQDQVEAKEFEETLETIKMMASNSVLEQEKETLEAILEKQEELDAATAVEKGRIVKTAAAAEDEDVVTVAGENREPEKRSSSMLKKKIKSMLDRLEVDLEQVDEEIGQKLKVLDLDHDGKISNYELRHAITNALRKTGDYSDERVDFIIGKLDLDKDGIISLTELDNILQQLKEEEKRKE